MKRISIVICAILFSGSVGAQNDRHFVPLLLQLSSRALDYSLLNAESDNSKLAVKREAASTVDHKQEAMLAQKFDTKTKPFRIVRTILGMLAKISRAVVQGDMYYSKSSAGVDVAAHMATHIAEKDHVPHGKHIGKRKFLTLLLMGLDVARSLASYPNKWSYSRSKNAQANQGIAIVQHIIEALLFHLSRGNKKASWKDIAAYVLLALRAPTSFGTKYSAIQRRLRLEKPMQKKEGRLGIYKKIFRTHPNASLNLAIQSGDERPSYSSRCEGPFGLSGQKDEYDLDHFASRIGKSNVPEAVESVSIGENGQVRIMVKDAGTLELESKNIISGLRDEREIVVLSKAIEDAFNFQAFQAQDVRRRVYSSLLKNGYEKNALSLARENNDLADDQSIYDFSRGGSVSYDHLHMNFDGRLELISQDLRRECNVRVLDTNVELQKERDVVVVRKLILSNKKRRMLLCKHLFSKGYEKAAYYIDRFYDPHKVSFKSFSHRNDSFDTFKKKLHSQAVDGFDSHWDLLIKRTDIDSTGNLIVRGESGAYIADTGLSFPQAQYRDIPNLNVTVCVTPILNELEAERVRVQSSSS